MDEYDIVMTYSHINRIHIWRVVDTSDATMGEGTSDDEEEAFQCAALFRGQLAEEKAEKKREENDREYPDRGDPV